MARFLISVVGQSNEFDSGPANSHRGTSGAGGLYMRQSPAVRGWWPSCCEAMAKRGHWLAVRNTALGSTALTDSWVGRVRTWQSGLTVNQGSYVIQGGNVFRKTNANVQSSTTTPAAGTGADGVTWALARAVTAADVNGAVYAPGDALFDPNGYVAAAFNAINGMPGWDATGVVVSIGQGDHTVSSTRQQYAQAMRNIAEMFSAAGHVVWLGMTCYMAGDAAREATFQNVMLPGRSDAITELSRNPLVRTGADLRTGLGVLSAGAADRTVGLQADELHLTTQGYEAAGLLWDQAFQQGGW